MNDDAIWLTDRSAWIAGKHRSHKKMLRSVGARLAREEVDALCQTNCAMAFANKPSSNRDRNSLWERCLPAKNDDAIWLTDRSACIAGKHRSHRKKLSPVGARLAREEVDALCQTNCAMAFAGKPSSNRKNAEPRRRSFTC
ncbi:hypothetical protein IV01_14445 [Pseudomonas syringae]|uniref:Uncharacterized protein n=1 Tax=Pseudomonas syringae TaxID=317 RepID=A0A085VHI5_PSESX|nr:hypothetical protein IV01_14445 [Pseudomonas syringae]